MFTFAKLGLIGKQLANILRLFVGDSYLIMAGLFFIFGFVMLIYSKPPRLGFKRNFGLVLAYLSLIVELASQYFDHEFVYNGFFNVFIKAIESEFGRANITTNVGGGMLGTLVYTPMYSLFGKLGVTLLAIIGIIVGFLMFFDVKFLQVLHGFQSVSQKVIEKNKDAGAKIIDKYGEAKDAYLQKKSDNREKLQDPLANTDDTFPDTDVFDTNKKTETKENDDVIFDFPDNKKNQVKEQAPADTEDYTDELPKSHAFEAEDQKMLQEHAKAELEKESSSQPDTNHKDYTKPSLNLLAPIKKVDQSGDQDLIRKNTQILESTFKSFGVEVVVKKAILGPTITRYEVQPAIGVKVSKIVNLSDDLALALAAKDIRIEAPIPGKPLVGIEVPNKTTSSVSFKDVMLHQDEKSKANPLDVPLGKDVTGAIVSTNLTKMPHLLIAGSTGSGKSVAINTMLTSILMKSYPDDVKLVLIDPKMVELSVYAGVPHLLIPVVTDAKLAANALHKTVKEMERRYKLFAAGGVRNITEYNEKVEQNNADKTKPVMNKLPFILVVVDELSDLMMVGGHDVEDAIVRLGQMARAAGIHMILATQRPSVDVITGLIKANVPSRISFAVSSGVDSRTILDQVGAEKLLGRGDMLYLPIGAAKPERVQGAYISVEEVERVVEFVKQQQQAQYNEDMIPQKGAESDSGNPAADEEDELYGQAVELVVKQQSASVSMLQRRFRIGYNRAARIIDQMEARGVVGPSEGSKPRQVLITSAEGNNAKQ
ncbi:FtsK SpoIIIE family protein [Lactobacillus psittaci DSM 15354]|uniref:DNA translocase FtsK n=2 Tax=Lactobacillus psittaci TaxID=116089 RepID=A0A0R1S4C7_9LACO|nr:FtsK SpoIIIE family protein [Lactobacillus psittaci DSM 15354]